MIFKKNQSSIPSRHQVYTFSFTLTSTEVFSEAAISLRHLEKSILEGNLYFRLLQVLLRTLESGCKFILSVVTFPAGGHKR